ncbi:hypothetical protein [Nocardia higoensis]|uniref:hypothetical protein n=1 Tax=Nocardia higoensis TaxID=228599 RepID=UPI00031D509B|nr:hypothetical protein [Nocardia higoensis]
MTGGFFNHYDDPDEFWDDEPLRPPTRPVPRVPDARPADPAPSYRAPAPTETVRQSTASYPSSTPPPVAAQPPERALATASSRTEAVGDIDNSGLGQLHNLIEEFSRLHAYTAEISNIMQEAFAAGPSEARGRDETGTVDVSLTRSGELTGITVAENWRAHLHTAQLGAAVVDAVRNADQRILEFTSITADRIGAIDKLEALDITAVTPTRLSAVESHGVAPSLGLEQILELAHEAMDRGEDADAERFTGSVGVEDELQVSVILGRREVRECVISIPWASDVRGGAIAAAVEEAYDQAYQRRLASAGSGIETALSGLAASAIQALTDMQVQPPAHGN